MTFQQASITKEGALKWDTAPDRLFIAAAENDITRSD